MVYYLVPYKYQSRYRKTVEKPYKVDTTDGKFRSYCFFVVEYKKIPEGTSIMNVS